MWESEVCGAWSGRCGGAECVGESGRCVGREMGVCGGRGGTVCMSSRSVWVCGGSGMWAKDVWERSV